ncbi:hypothetical protein [Ewingella americana]|uniref:hypothetical protein n=1 Tax=Ewingella americana TaxID=41202 RepID=UPI001386D198|nr:hypothetical protein [Ewingella americana]
MSGYLESLSKSELQTIIDLGKQAEKVMASKGASHSGGTSQFDDRNQQERR